MSFRGEVAARMSIFQDGGGVGGPFSANEISILDMLTDGTTAGKFDRAYMAERTLASAATDSLDVAGGLTDAFGASITMVEIAAIFILNKPRLSTEVANTTDLTLFGGSNPFPGILGGTTPTIGPIKPGGFAMLAAGMHASGIGAVVAATGDIVRIVNGSGASNKYQIGILGRSA